MNDFKVATLLDWLKEKYPYSVMRWIRDNYWIDSELGENSE